MERSVDLVTSWLSLWPWLFALVSGLGLAFALRQLRSGKPLGLLGWLWFLTALLPVSGIVPINGIMYEHWLYLPMAGFFLFLHEIWSTLPRKLTTIPTRYQLTILAGIFAVSAILTIRQNYFWSTPVRLYNHLLKYTASLRIYNNLGMAYAEGGQFDRALKAYDKALAINDKTAVVHHNRGNLFQSAGRLEEAAAAYEQALAIDSRFYYSYQPLITIYIYSKELQQAETLIDQAEKQFPESPLWQIDKIEVNKLKEEQAEVE